jgi:lantibiotic transport system ATP-binding protein
MKESLIYTRDLSFSFGAFEVLHNINMQVPEGSVYGFLGPNGAGKTTMIKIMLGLLKTSENRVYISGYDIAVNPIPVLAKTGAMVESPTVYQHLSGRENVEIIRIMRNLPRKKTEEVLKQAGLEDDSERKAGQYSTGMKQRLAVAIALLGDPDLLILDEPMNGLDPSGIIEIRDFLKRINSEYRTTILLSSHILGEIEKLATHIGIIDKGVLKFQGSIGELQTLMQESNAFIIRTNNNSKALVGLSKRFHAHIIDDTIKVNAAGETEVADAIKLLVETGFDIYHVSTCKSGLEELFLNVLKMEPQYDSKVY